MLPRLVLERAEARPLEVLEASEEAIGELVREGFDPKYGARPLRRAIQSQVEDAQSEKQKMLLDQTRYQLERSVKEQAAILGLLCEIQVDCVADASGVLHIRQVQVDYYNGPREQLSVLCQWIKQQLLITDEAILIQEGG